MSRPFSYSDENFTVIGNILFLHVKITKALMKFNTIIEIPPAIHDRMYNKSIHSLLSSSKDNNPNILWVHTYVTKSSSNGKFYFCTDENIDVNYVGFYLLSWYFLKDI